MRGLDGVVPYSMVPGNHDMVLNTHDSTLYNKYYSPERFAGQPWYGGHMGDTNDNNYCFFDAAGKVLEMLTDYQGLPNGGDGWLRSLKFVPAENKIHVRTYSPALDRENNDPKETFTLDYDMTAVQVTAD